MSADIKCLETKLGSLTDEERHKVWGYWAGLAKSKMKSGDLVELMDVDKATKTPYEADLIKVLGWNSVIEEFMKMECQNKLSH